MKKFILFSCLMLAVCTLGKAQSIDRDIISPAGGFYETGSIQMAWVIGDLVAGAYDIGHLIVSFDPGTNLPDYAVVSSQITVYPNPTTDKVFLNLDTDNIENCKYYLYDLQGREIQNRNITAKLTELSFAPFESGVYILRIIKEKTLVQEFKIIKR
jgi:hypothetical protein